MTDLKSCEGKCSVAKFGEWSRVADALPKLTEKDWLGRTHRRVYFLSSRYPNDVLEGYAEDSIIGIIFWPLNQGRGIPALEVSHWMPRPLPSPPLDAATSSQPTENRFDVLFKENGRDAIFASVCGDTREEATEGAELICRAVNVHDQLVAALSAISDFAYVGTEETIDTFRIAKIRQFAEAALAAAEKGGQ